MPETRALSGEMSNQYGKFAATLELCAFAEKDPAKLAAVMPRLGRKHAARGVYPEHYPVLIDVTIDAFANALGAYWTEEHELACRTALTHLGDAMMAVAAEHGEEGDG